MSKSEEGFAPILLIIVAVLGIALAVYLIGTKTNLFPHAASDPISGPIVPPMKGDINGDGLVNSADNTELQKYLGFSIATVMKADLNGDGKIDNSDAAILNSLIISANPTPVPSLVPTPIPTLMPTPIPTPIPTPVPSPISTLRNGIVSYWKFDELATNIFSDSAGHNQAIGNGTLFTDGKFSNGRGLTGSNSYINIADNSSFATDNMTVSGWVKPNNFGVNNFSSIFNRRPFNNGAGMTLEYAGYSNAAQGQLQCAFFITNPQGVKLSANVITQGSNKLTVGVWNQVACSYDGSAINVYINGHLAGSTNSPGKVTQATNMSVQIGRNAVDGENLNGVVDDFGYWGRALTPDEIAQLYSGGPVY